MKFRPIKSEQDYQMALKRLEDIFDAKIGTPEGDELEILGLNQSDLAKIIGLRSRASEILNKKRKLSIEMIRHLHQKMNISADVLIQDY